MSMPCLEISNVALADPAPTGLRGCYLDAPRTGNRIDGSVVEIVGWALGVDGPTRGMEVVRDGEVVRHVGMNQPRGDLAQAFPGFAWAGQSGFSTRVRMPQLGRFELQVRAVLSDGVRVPFGTIRLEGRWREQRSGAGGNDLVSVIVPCLDRQHSPDEAIESVRAQSYPHVEVVAVGNATALGRVAARHAWVKCIDIDDAELAAARNAGVRHSDGPYLVFLDPEDRLSPDALACALDSLQTHRDCAFTVGRWRRPRQTADMDPVASMPVGVMPDGYVSLLRGRSPVDRPQLPTAGKPSSTLASLPHWGAGFWITSCTCGSRGSFRFAATPRTRPN
jgi:hypothetical protein